MQGRLWLDIIADCYKRKQQEVEGSDTRSARHADMMKVMRDVRDNHLAEIRQEIASIPEREMQATALSLLDSLISFKMILTLANELKLANREVIKENIETKSGYEFSVTNYSREMDIVTNAFSAFLKATPLDELTPDCVKTFIQNQIESVCACIATMYKIGVDQLSLECKKNVVSDIILTCLSYVFLESDKQQLSKTAMAAAFVWLGKDDVLKPYRSLSSMMQTLALNKEANPLWNELALWMEGVYVFHRNLVVIKNGDRPLVDGQSYPPINSTDSAMKLRYGVTFYGLSLCVKEAVDVLKVKLSQQPAPDLSASLSAAGLFRRGTAASAKDDDGPAQSLPSSCFA